MNARKFKSILLVFSIWITLFIILNIVLIFVGGFNVKLFSISVVIPAILVLLYFGHYLFFPRKAVVGKFRNKLLNGKLHLDVLKTRSQTKIVTYQVLNLFPNEKTYQISDTDKRISTKTLIHIYAEFVNSNPLFFNQIIENDVNLNSFAYYQFKTIQSLCKAFEIGDIFALKNGSFITQSKSQSYLLLDAELKTYCQKNHLELQVSVFHYRRIHYVYGSLWKIRHKLEGLFDINGIGMVSIDIKMVVDHVGIQILKAINSEVQYIEWLLSLILSPNQKTFSIKELIENYDFPDVNLKALYVDNL